VTRAVQPDARILLIDDQEPNVRALRRVLGAAGYQQVSSTCDSREAAELFRRVQPDLVLLDLQMPHMDGLAVLEQLGGIVPATSYVPVLVLTGHGAPEARQRALALGATDFVAKPFDMAEVLLRIRNLLQTRRLHVRLQEENADLERRVEERSRELTRAQMEVLERLARAAECRDDDTGQHTHRVGRCAARLARALDLPASDVTTIERAAPLHDVGKIGIPDQILLKPGRLTPDEVAVMRTHTVLGAQLLAGGSSELVRVAEQIARHHHERWDGAGYPEGLSGDAIPLVARIVGLVDFFDALSHDRPYRPAWALEAVLEEIRSQRGRHFDPALVDAFLRLAWTPGSWDEPA